MKNNNCLIRIPIKPASANQNQAIKYNTNKCSVLSITEAGQIWLNIPLERILYEQSEKYGYINL